MVGRIVSHAKLKTELKGLGRDHDRLRDMSNSNDEKKRSSRSVDDMLDDFVDDLLTDRERAAVATYLLANPRKALEVSKLRRIRNALKALGRDVLEEPVPDPLKMIVRNATEEGYHRSVGLRVLKKSGM